MPTPNWSPGYISNQLHNVKRYNFQLIRTTSTFYPQKPSYKQGLMMVAILHFNWLAIALILIAFAYCRRICFQPAGSISRTLRACTFICVVSLALTLVLQLLLHAVVIRTLPVLSLHPADNGEIRGFMQRIERKTQHIARELFDPYYGSAEGYGKSGVFAHKKMYPLIGATAKLVRSYRNPLWTRPIPTPLMNLVRRTEWSYFFVFTAIWCLAILIVSLLAAMKKYLVSAILGLVFCCIGAILVTMVAVAIADACQDPRHAISQLYSDSVKTVESHSIKMWYMHVCREWYAGFKIQLEQYTKKFLHAYLELADQANSEFYDNQWLFLYQMSDRVRNVSRDEVSELHRVLPPRCDYDIMEPASRRNESEPSKFSFPSIDPEARQYTKNLESPSVSSESRKNHEITSSSDNSGALPGENSENASSLNNPEAPPSKNNENKTASNNYHDLSDKIFENVTSGDNSSIIPEALSNNKSEDPSHAKDPENASSSNNFNTFSPFKNAENNHLGNITEFPLSSEIENVSLGDIIEALSPAKNPKYAPSGDHIIPRSSTEKPERSPPLHGFLGTSQSNVKASIGLDGAYRHAFTLKSKKKTVRKKITSKPDIESKKIKKLKKNKSKGIKKIKNTRKTMRKKTKSPFKRILPKKPRRPRPTRRKIKSTTIKKKSRNKMSMTTVGRFKNTRTSKVKRTRRTTKSKMILHLRGKRQTHIPNKIDTPLSTWWKWFWGASNFSDPSINQISVMSPRSSWWNWFWRHDNVSTMFYNNTSQKTTTKPTIILYQLPQSEPPSSEGSRSTWWSWFWIDNVASSDIALEEAEKPTPSENKTALSELMQNSTESLFKSKEVIIYNNPETDSIASWWDWYWKVNNKSAPQETSTQTFSRPLEQKIYSSESFWNWLFSSYNSPNEQDDKKQLRIPALYTDIWWRTTIRPPTTPQPFYTDNPAQPYFLPEYDVTMRGLCASDRKLQIIVAQAFVLMMAGLLSILALIIGILRLKRSSKCPAGPCSKSSICKPSLKFMPKKTLSRCPDNPWTIYRRKNYPSRCRKKKKCISVKRLQCQQLKDLIRPPCENLTFTCLRNKRTNPCSLCKKYKYCKKFIPSVPVMTCPRRKPCRTYKHCMKKPCRLNKNRRLKNKLCPISIACQDFLPELTSIVCEPRPCKQKQSKKALRKCKRSKKNITCTLSQPCLCTPNCSISNPCFKTISIPFPVPQIFTYPFPLPSYLPCTLSSPCLKPSTSTEVSPCTIDSPCLGGFPFETLKPRIGTMTGLNPLLCPEMFSCKRKRCSKYRPCLRKPSCTYYKPCLKRIRRRDVLPCSISNPCLQNMFCSVIKPCLNIMNFPIDLEKPPTSANVTSTILLSGTKSHVGSMPSSKSVPCEVSNPCLCPSPFPGIKSCTSAKPCLGKISCPRYTPCIAKSCLILESCTTNQPCLRQSPCPGSIPCTETRPCLGTLLCPKLKPCKRSKTRKPKKNIPVISCTRSKPCLTPSPCPAVDSCTVVKPCLGTLLTIKPCKKSKKCMKNVPCSGKIPCAELPRLAITPTSPGELPCSLSNPCLKPSPCLEIPPCTASNPCLGTFLCSVSTPCLQTTNCSQSKPCLGLKPPQTSTSDQETIPCTISNPCLVSSCKITNPCLGLRVCPNYTPCFSEFCFQIVPCSKDKPCLRQSPCLGSLPCSLARPCLGTLLCPKFRPCVISKQKSKHRRSRSSKKIHFDEKTLCLPCQASPYDTPPCQRPPCQQSPCQKAPYQRPPCQQSSCQKPPCQRPPCQQSPCQKPPCQLSPCQENSKPLHEDYFQPTHENPVSQTKNDIKIHYTRLPIQDEPHQSPRNIESHCPKSPYQESTYQDSSYQESPYEESPYQKSMYQGSSFQKPYREPLYQDLSYQEPPFQDTPCQRPPCQKSPCHKPPCEESPCQRPPCQESPCQRPPCQESPCQRPPCQESPCERPPCQDSPCQRPPCQKSLFQRPPCQESPCQRPPCEDTPCQRPPCQESPCQKPPCLEASYQRPPCQDSPCQTPSCEDSPCQRPPCQGSPCQNPPCSEASYQRTPCQESPCQRPPCKRPPCQDPLCQNNLVSCPKCGSFSKIKRRSKSYTYIEYVPSKDSMQNTESCKFRNCKKRTRFSPMKCNNVKKSISNSNILCRRNSSNKCLTVNQSCKKPKPCLKNPCRRDKPQLSCVCPGKNEILSSENDLKPRETRNSSLRWNLPEVTESKKNTCPQQNLYTKASYNDIGSCRTKFCPKRSKPCPASYQRETCCSKPIRVSALPPDPRTIYSSVDDKFQSHARPHNTSRPISYPKQILKDTQYRYLDPKKLHIYKPVDRYRTYSGFNEHDQGFIPYSKFDPKMCRDIRDKYSDKNSNKRHQLKYYLPPCNVKALPNIPRHSDSLISPKPIYYQRPMQYAAIIPKVRSVPSTKINKYKMFIIPHSETMTPIDKMDVTNTDIASSTNSKSTNCLKFNIVHKIKSKLLCTYLKSRRRVPQTKFDLTSAGESKVCHDTKITPRRKTRLKIRQYRCSKRKLNQDVATSICTG